MQNEEKDEQIEEENDISNLSITDNKNQFITKLSNNKTNTNNIISTNWNNIDNSWGDFDSSEQTNTGIELKNINNKITHSLL